MRAFLQPGKLLRSYAIIMYNGIFIYIPFIKWKAKFCRTKISIAYGRDKYSDEIYRRTFLVPKEEKICCSLFTRAGRVVQLPTHFDAKKSY